MEEAPEGEAPAAEAKDIWTLIEEKKAAADAEAKAANTNVDADREACCIFVGPRQSGKSTLIHGYMFKDKVIEPKPTTSLDYKYTRSSVGISMHKDLSHFWELGGGRLLEKLLQIPMGAARVEDIMIVIVVDLSRPWRVLEDTEHWLGVVRALSDAVVAKLKQTRPDAVTLLQQRAWAPYGPAHADKASLTLLPLPTLIVANKFDVFKGAETQYLKVMSRTLRTLAHLNGASLYYCTKHHKQLMAAYRSRISRHVMGKELGSQSQTEYTKPIIVPAGTDSLAAIGEGAALKDKSWQKYFPAGQQPSGVVINSQDENANVNLLVDEDQELAKPVQLNPEPIIDVMLAQREQDLKRVQREVELKRNMT